MKKSKTMRAASFLLVLTLMTSCFVGSTFAKYTTTTTGSDEARVAYWGFDQNAVTTIDLFDGEYTNVNSVDIDGDSEDDNVIAPGTFKEETFAFGYTNYQTDKITAPEVAYTFTVDADITGDYDLLDSNNNFYWTLKAPGALEANKYGTVALLTSAIEALAGDADGVKEYAAGTLPTAFTAADEEYIVGWVWEFENTTGTDDEKKTQDIADTAMGNAIDLEDIKFTITINATQTD